MHTPTLKQSAKRAQRLDNRRNTLKPYLHVSNSLKTVEIRAHGVLHAIESISFESIPLKQAKRIAKRRMSGYYKFTY